MLVELFNNLALTVVSSGGSTAPASGTVETWTVATPSAFPSSVAGVSQFHVADTVSITETIAVTNVSGSTWTVTRGAEGSTPVAHAGGFTVCQVTTAGTLAGFLQLAAGGTLGAYFAPAVTTLTFGSSIPVNAALGNVFAVTLTASTGTLANPTSPVDGQVIRVRVTQDATGSRTLAYGTAYDFGSAGSPTLTATAAKTDILAFEYVAALSKWCYLGTGLGY